MTLGYGERQRDRVIGSSSGVPKPRLFSIERDNGPGSTRIDPIESSTSRGPAARPRRLTSSKSLGGSREDAKIDPSTTNIGRDVRANSAKLTFRPNQTIRPKARGLPVAHRGIRAEAHWT